MLRRRHWVPAVGAALVLLVVVAATAWAAPHGGDGDSADGHTAMHTACESGDVEGMTEAMNSLTDEDWQAMEEQMNDGRHGDMGMGGMMGGWHDAGGGWSDMMEWR